MDIKTFQIRIFSLIIFFLFISVICSAGIIVVKSNKDTGRESLREAIENAARGDEITFALKKGVETITINSELKITKSISIDGKNSTKKGEIVTVQVTQPGVTPSRVFFINTENKEDSVILENMIIRGGDISKLEENNEGGGIFVKSGSLELINSTISDAKAKRGGGICGESGNSLKITNSKINDNKAMDDYGGGVWTEATTTITNSLIANNTTAHCGGGIAIWSDGNLEVTNSTIAYNIAEHRGGGIINNGKNLTVINSTIAYNIANSSCNDYDGGGISGSFSVWNSIIANNFIKITNNKQNREDISGNISDSGYNVFGRISGGEYTSKDPTTWILQGETGDIYAKAGGPSKPLKLINKLDKDGTLHLGENSLAIKVIPAKGYDQEYHGSPETDQRGIKRSGPFTNIGAFNDN